MDSFGGLPPPSPAVPAPSNSVFASLHRRSRTADSPSSVTKTIETRDAAAREAKRFLLQVVRNDWAYPPLPTPAAAAAAAEPDTSRAAEGAPAEEPEEPREIAWRHREMDNSGSEWEDGLDGPEGLDPYRFESPEAVARGISDRRRKRRKIQEDEMKWNEGLSLWTARRDAWTGAKAPERPADSATSGAKVNLEAYRQSISSEESYNGSYDTDLVDTESQYTLSRPASNASAAGHVKPSEPPADNAPTGDNNVEQLPVSLDTKAALDCQAAAASDAKQGEDDDDDECLVPIMGPLIPDSNMLRAAITPNVYPAIYSRLVIQSNTPAVPINLSHMTRALVQGWKTNGEWPPKPTPTKDVPVIKRPKQPAVNTSAGANANDHGEMRDGKGRRLSGVSNAVKKVLGLSSFNSGSRLHLRSNSHSGSVSRPPTEDSLNAP